MSNVVVPQLGESVSEARVARWLKHEGDRVETGEPLVELETDKIDLEVGADHAGVLSSIKHHEGDDVKVGEVLAVVEDGVEASRTAPKSPSGPERTTPTGPRPASPPTAAAPSQTKASRGERNQSGRPAEFTQSGRRTSSGHAHGAANCPRA